MTTGREDVRSGGRRYVASCVVFIVIALAAVMLWRSGRMRRPDAAGSALEPAAAADSATAASDEPTASARIPPGPAVTPMRLRRILGEDDEGASYKLRAEALDALAAPLNDAEIRALIQQMDRVFGEDPLSSDDLNALKNEVANTLRAHAGAKAMLVDALIAIHEDPRHDEVWRDYCLQHLGALCAEAAPKLRSRIAGTLFHAADGREGTLPGTALLALAWNAEMNAVPRADVAAAAFRAAGDAARGDEVRATALQVCAGLGETDALPIARALARAVGRSVFLRAAAIGAIGILGQSDDEAMLAGLAQSDDLRVRRAAESAQRRLAGRGSAVKGGRS